MPTYEYKCKNCGYIFEKFQKITDKPITSCPKCNGEVFRLISGGGGIIFKGSGFYITDSKKSDSKKSKEKVNSSSSGTNSSNSSNNNSSNSS